MISLRHILNSLEEIMLWTTQAFRMRQSVESEKLSQTIRASLTCVNEYGWSYVSCASATYGVTYSLTVGENVQWMSYFLMMKGCLTRHSDMVQFPTLWDDHFTIAHSSNYSWYNITVVIPTRTHLIHVHQAWLIVCSVCATKWLHFHADHMLIRSKGKHNKSTFTQGINQ